MSRRPALVRPPSPVYARFGSVTHAVGVRCLHMARDVSAGLVVRPDLMFNGVKVFSATMFAPREQLGETVTQWMAANPQLTVTEFVVTQSSDSQFHCVAITVFYWEKLPRR